MQLKKISAIFHFSLIIVVLSFNSIPASGLFVETDAVTQDLPVPTINSTSRRTSAAVHALAADNVNYEEELMLEIWRDGSVKSVWKLEDAGNSLLTFPTALPAPLNSSYPGIQDLRIDLQMSEVPQLSAEWGLMSDFDRYAFDYSYPAWEDNYGDADYASFSSNEIRLTFRVWNETVNNSGVLYDGLNDSQELIRDIVSDVSAALGTTFHLMTNRTGSGSDFLNDYGLEQSWRAFLFDMNNSWNTLFSTLPLNAGLTNTTTSRLMQADAKSLYIVAEWDEKPDREDVNQTYEEDLRWEFEAMLGILEKEKLSLGATSNQIYLKDVMDFDQLLYSHAKANASSIAVRLPHGSSIDAIEPFDAANVHDIGYFELDVINNHNKRITEFDSVTFTLDALPMPSLVLQATANTTVVSPGDIVQIDYNITNIGETPAYNVFLIGFDNTTGSPGDEWNFINVTAQDFNYTLWNPSSGEAEYSISQIDPGETIIHSIYLNATTPISRVDTNFEKFCDVTYDSVSNPSAPSFVGWSATGIVNDGNELRFWYNHSNAGASFELDAIMPKSVVRVGETITLFVNVTNTGNATATDIDWVAPNFGFAQTDRTGTISSLNESESMLINVTYIVDTATSYLQSGSRGYYPTRQLGGIHSFDWYITSYDDPYFGTQSLNVDASEIELDVLPAANLTLGPFLTVNVQQTSDTIPSGERATVSITVANVGNMTAENVVVNSEFSDADFAFYGGAGTLSGGQGTAQARRFTHYWGILAAGDSFSFSYKLEAQKNATLYTHTYATADWIRVAFGGLTRAFYPRTYDWEAPIIDGPVDLETARNEGVATTANLTWSTLDEHPGSYRILLANTSSAISSDDASAISSANLTFVEIASGTWGTANSNYTYSLAGLNDGFYLFTFEATDCCGNIATDMVAVTVTTACEPLILSGPADLEIIRKKGAAITDSLSWGVSAGNSGTYRIFRANASIVSSGNAYMISTVNLTFVEVASGIRTSTTSQITHSLAALNDGFYPFTLEVIDYCGNLANDTVIVTVKTQPEQEDEGLIEDFQSFLSENAGFLLITGALAVIVIAEGVVIYFTRK